MIVIRDLTFAYSGQAPLFENFNLRVRPGEAWSVIGPSGCGKTTLLYLLAGLRHPAGGTIVIRQAPLSRPRPHTGLVLQDHGLLPWRTVAQNARLGLTIRQFYGPDGRHAPAEDPLDKDQINRRVENWLRILKIDHLRHQYPSTLSRGQRQRTAIARTMAMAPDLLLLDEPFSALDAATRKGLQASLADLHRRTATTRILVTHDIEIAVGMGEKILVLNEGCNRHPRVIQNPAAGDDQRSAALREKCGQLEKLLGAPP